MTADRPRLGVSACLLGREVRHDGRHKRSAFLVDQLAPHVEVVAVCPEVEIGLPVPRPTLQLVGERERPRLIEGATGADRTDAMNRWADGRVAELAGAGLDGFVLKARSPSCGLVDVPVRSPEGMEAGSGLFAAALRRARPALPAAQETWLDDAGLRHGFLVRLFTHARLRSGLAAGGPAALPSLHAAHRLLLAAHAPDAEPELARLAARAAAEARSPLAGRYVERAMAALARPAPPSRGLGDAHAGDDAAARLQAEPYPPAIAPR
jgi:uncharacterized protein YbbK (DUF523 family)